jgi:hypothetical protein
MEPLKLNVRCMAWQEGGVWVALCIDFSLVVQGDTLDSVRKSMHEQIGVYVNEALSVDAEHSVELLSRKARLRDRMRYAFWAAVQDRPRLRNVALLVERVRNLFAYSEPMPLRTA